ncbi:asparagine synthase (glutamine-hydrolyzing) [Flavilitoribacter nigricans]|uniref:asparagine synthase (glutamine-hydrolyzing) n=1 Tax=Flavilitoribacter nigricans (strain ATCC 23147 / DSM 23189 / NBRC 102662 / NCIMB 1420 / SS-2) TaxID=1122177 RepID=A0A2D0NJB9_FLAN2|nr:asparagine synthase (glutamine-hydrolyzing) [Flavilitoribacter nigricans]PHN08591.1 asparagine synthase (glutamine-hydrolyzing) [Flavilitoribacter nigricans DSM 23189 = NBRC 102662]
MCGICGIIDLKKKLSREERDRTVRRMNEKLLHRGPDSAGYHSDERASLAMRRLSIIDLTTGQQPIFNEAGDIGVFLNGEIYNYLELKEDLLSRDHRFTTNSDTEVLVHLYESYGDNMVHHLKGMFAFCIFDLRRPRFFLARDRFGEKPLFYHHQDGVFSFSSEISSLLENRRINRKVDQEALGYYFRTSLIPESLTLLERVYSLPAGCTISLSPISFDIESYFTIDYRENPGIQSNEDASALIRPHLEAAVRRQTVSDVPIGAFLSGGIDSSTVVALLQSQSERPVQTFTARFEHQPYDESVTARKVADRLGTDHHEVLIPNFDFGEELFWEIIDHVGLPFRDSSAIPSYLISREISRHVKVALSGDGGDELFGGYDLFRWYTRILDTKRVPRPVRRLGREMLGMAAWVPGIRDNSRLRKWKRAAETSLQAVDVIPISLNEMFSDPEMKSIFPDSNTAVRNNYPALRQYPDAADAWSPLRRIMYYRLQHTLPVNMLVKIDRMSMANSLEVRAPFLDPDLFAASAQLPDRFLVRDGLGKYILRHMMRDVLPEEVFSGPKQGFSIPLHRYKNEAFTQLAQRLVYDENPFPEMFRPEFLDEVFQRGIHQDQSNARHSVFRSTHQLWMLMQLFGWAKRFRVTC